MDRRPILSLADYLNGRSWQEQLRSKRRSTLVQVTVTHRRIAGVRSQFHRGGGSKKIRQKLETGTNPKQTETASFSETDHG